MIIRKTFSGLNAASILECIYFVDNNMFLEFERAVYQVENFGEYLKITPCNQHCNLKISHVSTKTKLGYV